MCWGALIDFKVNNFGKRQFFDVPFGETKRQMRILLLGASVLASGFKELGHHVVTCTTDGTGDIKIHEFPTSVQTVFRQLPNGWNPDFILLTDDSTYAMFWGMEEVDVPLGWFVIDSHIHLEWHRAYAAIFDFIFVAQRDYVPSYECDRERQMIKWLPLCTFPFSGKGSPPPKLYDLSFVGKLNSKFNPERRVFIEQIQERYPIYVAAGEFVSIFTRSKMVLNQCAGDDVNFRTFEAMACGSLLLMERCSNGLEELFHDGVHLILYEKGNVSQVIEIAEYYSRHDLERESIALAGQTEVLNKHTYTHRAQTILNDLLTGDMNKRVGQRKAKLGEILFLLARVYQYVSALYDSHTRCVSQDSNQFRDLSVIRNKFEIMSCKVFQDLDRSNLRCVG